MLRTEAYDKESAKAFAASNSDLPAPYYEEGEFNHFTEVAKFQVPYTDGDKIITVVEVRRLGYDAVDKEFDLRGVKVVLPMPITPATTDLDCCPACVMTPAVIKYKVVSVEGKIPSGFRKATQAEVNKMQNKKSVKVKKP
jgi:hypothetical protein